MSDVDGAYASGMPCWFDMMIPSRDSAMAFYGSVLGWTFDGDLYPMCQVRGKPVAAIAEPQPGEPAPEQSNRTVYLATDDCAAALRRVTDAGGQVVKPQEDAMVGWAGDRPGHHRRCVRSVAGPRAERVTGGRRGRGTLLERGDQPRPARHRRVLPAGFGYDTEPRGRAICDVPTVVVTDSQQPWARVCRNVH